MSKTKEKKLIKCNIDECKNEVDLNNTKLGNIILVNLKTGEAEVYCNEEHWDLHLEGIHK